MHYHSESDSYLSCEALRYVISFLETYSRPIGDADFFAVATRFTDLPTLNKKFANLRKSIGPSDNNGQPDNDGHDMIGFIDDPRAFAASVHKSGRRMASAEYTDPGAGHSLWPTVAQASLTSGLSMRSALLRRIS